MATSNKFLNFNFVPFVILSIISLQNRPLDPALSPISAGSLTEAGKALRSQGLLTSLISPQQSSSRTKKED
ncbi:hypothetical protein Csa_002982 [Cucumis sativus]|uniref:Uncharacterized protein n=1 Tax=Cucumis sativus TaxID=3659 RepID=A0A0A0KL31_CUCSA|nr:hypothetical protein Csa_002982 [Cucumis sativus]